MNLEPLIFDEEIDFKNFNSLKRAFKKLEILYKKLIFIVLKPFFIQNLYLKKYIEKIRDFAIDYLSKIYKIPKKVLSSIPIYVTKMDERVGGVYKEIKNVFGDVLYRAIFINEKYLKNPFKFAEIIAHELTHYIQSLKGKLKHYNLINYLRNYWNDENEKEAFIVGKSFSNYIKTLYGNHFIK